MEKRKNKIENFETFKDRVMALMEFNNVTDDDVAQFVGVKRYVIFHWLINVRCPTDLQIEMIAKFFGVSKTFILGFPCEVYLPKEIEALIIIERKKLKNEISDLSREINQILNKYVKKILSCP